MPGFSKEVSTRLKYYVYLYVDPRDSRVFYVGKGKGNRAFAHVDASGNSEKARRIRELRKLKLEPRIEILRYGLVKEETALHIEAAAIDLLHIEEVLNEVRGHGAEHGPRDDWQEIQHRFAANEVAVKEPAMAFNITKSYRPTHSAIQLYDATRSAWIVRRDKFEQAKFAFAMYGGVIREVYEVTNWLKAGSTMISYDRKSVDPKRFEFVGVLASDNLRKKYRGKKIAGLEFSQNPVRYLNIGKGRKIEE